jgi:hypothetical protein
MLKNLQKTARVLFLNCSNKKLSELLNKYLYLLSVYAQLAKQLEIILA